MRVMSEPKRKNDYPVPVEDWWPEAVRRVMKERTPPMKQVELAHSIGVTEYDISRCLNGRAMMQQVEAISDHLNLPRPVAVFRSEEEAELWHKVVVLRSLDAKIAAVAPDVADTPADRHGKRPAADTRKRAKSRGHG